MDNQHIDERYELYCKMLDELDESCRLIIDYDSVPHNYGSATLYQAESQIIHQVGNRPGITANEIAAIFKKTPSACSQLIRKLRKKELITQKRNKENNREYQLYLTEDGEKIFRDHDHFEKCCYQRSYQNLSSFSEEDFKTYIAIQQKLNETFAMDVEESNRDLPAINYHH